MSVTLRYNEYYGMQEKFDLLYERSKAKATKTVDLYEFITSRENILLAYRSIKSNTGSKTKGTDGLTIADYKIIDEDEFIKGIQKCLLNYHPRMVRRIMIPKGNGKERPLGIPTMRDRLIQQALKQVLEPIVEQRFHNHSYGFRSNRSTHHAIARSATLINIVKLHYVIDVDIKSFFDEVDHRKLIEQIHNIGIEDKRVQTIINRMLKAEIEGEGVPTKGTPQGGILSPLLSNIVLNELDWWISNQWETFETRKKYSWRNTSRALKNSSNLKQMYIVRYADDFKIFTNNHVNAKKVYHAVRSYLKEHLHLEISPEKSTITNLRKRSSDFLGFELRAIKKKKKHVAKTNVMKKKQQKILSDGIKHIRKIQKKSSPQNIKALNAWILGIHNYFKIATHVSNDFSRIAYYLNRTMYNRFKSIGKYEIPDKPSRVYKRFYGRNNCKTWKIGDINVFPIAVIKTSNPKNFSQEICNHTMEGRQKIFKGLEAGIDYQIQLLMKLNISNRSVEYMDNRISKYSMQKGKCAITGEFLIAYEVHCHHIVPVKVGGKDTFENLVVLHSDMHKLVHAVEETTIKRYSKGLSDLSIDKINKLRKYLNLFEITT